MYCFRVYKAISQGLSYLTRTTTLVSIKDSAGIIIIVIITDKEIETQRGQVLEVTTSKW